LCWLSCLSHVVPHLRGSTLVVEHMLLGCPSSATPRVSHVSCFYVDFSPKWMSFFFFFLWQFVYTEFFYLPSDHRSPHTIWMVKV
jgi:hypothetical protein